MRPLVFMLSIALLIGQMIRIPIGSQGLQLIDLILLMILVQLTIDYILNPKKIYYFHIYSLFVFFSWAFISLIYGLSHYGFGILSTPDLLGGILAACRFLFPMLILTYILNSKLNFNHASRNIRTLYNSGLLVIIFGIIQSIFIENFAIRFGPDYDWDVQGNRLVSIFLDPNLAASFTSGMVVLTFLLLMNKVGSRRILVIGAFLSITATFLTLSRGGIIGLVIGLLVFYLYHKKKIRIFRASNFFIFSAIILLVITLIANVFDLEFLIESDRFGATNDSAIIRFNNYMALINIYLENPIFGVGFNYSRVLYPDYFYGFSGNYVDGGILVLVASLGTAGTLFLFIAFLKLKDIARLDMSLFLPFIIMFCVQSFATSTIFYPLIICFFVTTLALTQYAILLREK